MTDLLEARMTDLLEAAMTQLQNLSLATAAGWWAGCVAAGKRWASQDDDHIMRICHDMLQSEIDVAAFTEADDGRDDG